MTEGVVPLVIGSFVVGDTITLHDDGMSLAVGEEVVTLESRISAVGGYVPLTILPKEVVFPDGCIRDPEAKVFWADALFAQ